MSTMTMIHFACDICEAVRDATKRILVGIWNLCVVFGYARAAGKLSRLGFHEEAKSLMLELKSKN